MLEVAQCYNSETRSRNSIDGSKIYARITEEGEHTGLLVDLCNFDPGYDVDLLVKAPLRAMTAIWMGLTTVRQEIDGKIFALEGDKAIAGNMQDRLGLSLFANVPKMQEYAS